MGIKINNSSLNTLHVPETVTYASPEFRIFKKNSTFLNNTIILPSILENFFGAKKYNLERVKISNMAVLLLFYPS